MARPAADEKRRFGRRSFDFSPLDWRGFFAGEKDVQVPGGTFRVYTADSDVEGAPVLVLLHGGGYSSLTWSLFCVEVKKKIDCSLLAIDLRGHGSTSTQDDADLSLETLASDVVNVMEQTIDSQARRILVGHSMGGAVAVQVADLAGADALCVIDVVEGTAMPALASMQAFLRGRPSTFESLEKAITWCYQSGQTRNREAARVSMPGQVVSIISGKLASDEAVSESGPTPGEFKWRVDLAGSEPHWQGWFKGMSRKFLACAPPKLLLLANVHGLDTELTIGQMQGKFQMQVLARSGHAIHEDVPEQIADILAKFLTRHKLASKE